MAALPLESHGRRDLPPPEGTPLVRTVVVLLRHRRLVLAIIGLCAIVTAGVLLLRDRTYTATAVFMPEARRPLGGGGALSGLALQFGLSLTGGESAQNAAFYADLVRSPAVLNQLVTTPFEFSTDTGTVKATLIELYRSRGRTDALRRDYAVRRVADAVSAVVMQRTGVVRLTVTTPWPALSREVGMRLLDLVNRFNLESRRSEATAERRFTEQRVADVRGDLREAENRMQEFLLRNRDYRNSPALTFEAERLTREISMQQAIFTTLVQAYEQAKIDEVRDTPVITIVEPPLVPVRPDPRGVVKKTVLALFVGMVLAGMAAFALEGLAPKGEREGGLAELRSLARDTWSDFRRPWRLLRRRAA